MDPEQLLVLQAEMRRRLREDKNPRKTLVPRARKPRPPIELPPCTTKTVNGVTITVCPPAYDKDLEFDRHYRHYSPREKDPYEAEEDKWCPERSEYKALCNAANGGSYLVLDTDDRLYEQSVGHSLARQLIEVLRRYLVKNKPLPLAWQELLGCNLERFKRHIERQFTPEMTWGNWGEWHLDHIKPLVSFSLDFRPELLAACNYRNLQPLWAPDNLSKGGKVTS